MDITFAHTHICIYIYIDIHKYIFYATRHVISKPRAEMLAGRSYEIVVQVLHSKDGCSLAKRLGSRTAFNGHPEITSFARMLVLGPLKLETATCLVEKLILVARKHLWFRHSSLLF